MHTEFAGIFAEFSAGHPWFVHAAGLAASIVSLLLWLPQVRTTWRHRNNATEMAGISSATQYLLIINQLMWLVYGLLINSFWVWSSLIVNLPAAILTLLLIHRAKRQLASSSSVTKPSSAPQTTAAATA